MTAYQSPSSRRAWIEICFQNGLSEHIRTSPSSRRAWIEIVFIHSQNGASFVALLAEGVDRNIARNKGIKRKVVVALLAEGVDRNPKVRASHTFPGLGSPSSRRAWIEIKTS